MFEKHIKRPGPIPFPICGNRYFIDINGLVYGTDGRPLPVIKDQEGYSAVFADLWDQVRYYRVADLMAIAYKNVQMPFHLWNRVEGFCIDNDQDNLRAGNIGYRFRNGPVEHPKRPGYYYVPMMTKYVVNESGVMLNGNTGHRLAVSIKAPCPEYRSRGGYRNYATSLDVGVRYVIGRHRALCLVFKPYPNAVDRLDVNHIDGTPGSDDLANLEWATRSQNNYHAVNMGLSKAFAVIVNDLRTGKVTTYPSIGQCAAALGLKTDESIRWRLKQHFGKVFEDGTMVKLADDDREFPKIGDVEGAIKRARRRNEILVRNPVSGEITEFESLAAVAKVYGIEADTISYRLNAGLKQPYFGIQFKYRSDDSDWEDFPESEWVVSIKAEPVGVVAKNWLTGESIAFPSIAECTKVNDRYGLGHSLRQRLQPRYRDGWQFKSIQQDWSPALLVEGCENRIVTRRLETGELLHFDSARHAGKELKIEPKTINRVADSGGYLVVDGYQCKYIDDPRPWVEPDPIDRELLIRRHPKVGFWKQLTNIETGESRYFYTVDEILSVLETVNSAPVLHRQIKKGLPLDGKYKVTNYRPKQLSDK